MRIGIISLHLSCNYGGNLQSYALQTALERLGHSVEVINKKPYFELPSTLTVIKRYVNKYVLGRNIDIRVERNNNIRIARSLDNKKGESLHKVRQFADRYIHKRDIDFFSELSKQDYDAYVVGSDQCWRPLYATPIQGYFLSFAKSWNVKRLSYAASFGVDKWEYSEYDTLKCKDLVRKFGAVSVREDSGVKLCKDYLEVNAKHVLDPTMLLTKEDYLAIIDAYKQEKECESVNGLFCYMLDITERKQSVMNSVSMAWNTEYTLCKESYMEEWLNAFYSAKVVLVDSFHGTVFSIIFNKPFWVVGNAKRGNARFASLLKMFGLEERLIDLQDCSSVDWKTEINWQSVNEKLEHYRRSSITFLSDCLGT